MNIIEKHKYNCCEHCDNFHSCTDLDGELLDEQIKICIEANK